MNNSNQNDDKNDPDPVRRKRLLINPVFQLNFLIHILIGLFLCIFVFYLADIYFFRQMFIQGINLKLPPDHPYFRLILDEKILRKKIFIITSFITSVLLFIFGIILSHKIAGPLARIHHYINSLAQKKKVNRFALRSGDYFQEFNEDINILIESLQGKFPDSDAR